MQLAEQMQQTPFLDGLPANIFTLTNKLGSTISLMDVGATWLSCKIQIQGKGREVLLGINSMQKHLKQQAYLGATVGRYANRIKAGKFVINGKQFQTSVNQAENTLHGGVEGFDKRRWQVAEQLNDKITFSLTSRDGDQGFPGNLVVTVSYQFNEDNEVSIEYRAKTDKTCPVNLTNHAYFNLMGADAGGDCLTHQLQIHADQYLPSDKNGIPIDDFQSVRESSFDFLKKKTIKQDFLTDQQQHQQSGYDHSFLLKSDYQDAKRVALTLTAPDESLQLSVSTNKPTIHIYTGNFLAGCPSRGKQHYKNQAGIALETQFPPDAPNNQQGLQGAVYLQPHQDYHSITRYHFKVLSSPI
ncbi:galactose-1-epimerase [Psychromonas hadalis]|uniref:galactose-1-epimerase n=1 Tax=Psychromonas hadalis TaxID=211669 RepID=UPI0003B76468|nr:galactose-1-epimerase [Psychromonas hadalis]